MQTEAVENNEGSTPRNEAEVVHRRVRIGSLFDIAICTSATGLEAFATYLRLTGRLGTPSLLLLHLLIMCALAAMLALRIIRGADTRFIALVFIATTAAGSIGAFTALLLGLLLKLEKQQSQLLQDWYRRISGQVAPDRLAELHEKIAAGRARDPEIESARRFGAILENGSLADKQRMLGVIAQKYHADFAPLLLQAMNSPDAPIRVQAAAVATKLRTTFKARLGALMTAASAPCENATQGVALARSLLDLTGSKILEDADVAAACQSAKKLCATALELEPSQTDALMLSANVFASEGDDAAAAEILKPLVELGRPDALDAYRSCLLRLRRYRDFASTNPDAEALHQPPIGADHAA